MCVVGAGVAIADRLKAFKVKKFIYTDVAPRPELANQIQAEYGEFIHALMLSLSLSLSLSFLFCMSVPPQT